MKVSTEQWTDARGSHRNEEHEPGQTTLCLRHCGLSSHKTAVFSLSGTSVAEIADISLTLFPQHIRSINVFNCSACRFAADPDEIVRMLRALRNGSLFLGIEREISAGLVEKFLKLDGPSGERLYDLYREHGARIGGRRMDCPWKRLEQ